MTTEIPPRPSAPLGMAWAAHYAHQEAVARVAVEALQVTAGASGICEETGKPICAFCGYVEHADWCRVGEALAKIKASGWQP